jgi:hypothetical protein
MELKLVSTELSEETIQVTYTDGQPEDNAKALLILRTPFDGDLKKSMMWNQMNAMRQLADWASEEFRRLRNEVESM